MRHTQRKKKEREKNGKDTVNKEKNRHTKTKKDLVIKNAKQREIQLN